MIMLFTHAKLVPYHQEKREVACGRHMKIRLYNKRQQIPNESGNRLLSVHEDLYTNMKRSDRSRPVRSHPS